MREIQPQRKPPVNPWLWVSITLGVCLAALVVYDAFSTESAGLALSEAKAKASARERELQRQVEQLKRSLGESDARLASANLRIQELVAEREMRKEVVAAKFEPTGAKLSTADVKREAGAPNGNTRKNDLLIADAVRDFNNGRLQAAKFKLEELVMNDPTDVVACEVLVVVLRGVMDAEVAKRRAERSPGDR